MTYVLASFPLIVAPILWRLYGGSLSASGRALRAQVPHKQVGTLLPNVRGAPPPSSPGCADCYGCGIGGRRFAAIGVDATS
jgi:hypothetical protein